VEEVTVAAAAASVGSSTGLTAASEDDKSVSHVELLTRFALEMGSAQNMQMNTGRHMDQNTHTHDLASAEAHAECRTCTQCLQLRQHCHASDCPQVAAVQVLCMSHFTHTNES